jgi:hypothetical protein
MRYFLALVSLIFTIFNTAKPITIGGMYLTPEQEASARKEFLKNYPDGSQLVLRMGTNNQLYLAALKEPEQVIRHLGFQKEPYYITLHHKEGTDLVTFEFPPLKNDEAWAQGPWKIVPQHGSIGPRILLWHEKLGGYLRTDDNFSTVSVISGDDRSGNISFWYYAESTVAPTPGATPTKEYVFKELAKGAKVTLWSNSNKKFVHYRRVNMPMEPGKFYVMPPTKAEITMKAIFPQIYQVEINEAGVFFMSPGYNKPATPSVPGFGPFNVIPQNPKKPNLNQVYLQNAYNPTTYIAVQKDGTVVTNAPEPTSFAIRLNKFPFLLR